MDEMISRSAAIEAIEKHIRTAEEPYQLTDADKVMNHAFEIAASCVYNLSATEADVPDINDGDIKSMKNDCISRQAVLKLLHTLPPEEAMTKAMLIQSVQQMSAAQPERKRGKWIDDGDPFMWVCDVCGYRVKRYNNTRYCPHCGAKMEVDDGSD